MEIHTKNYCVRTGFRNSYYQYLFRQPYRYYYHRIEKPQFTNNKGRKEWYENDQPIKIYDIVSNEWEYYGTRN